MPVPIFVVTVKRGAILIGALDDSGVMVGFVYSIAGLKDGRPMQWSHMLGVLDSHRNSGLGHDLKLAQRQRALAMGLDLIEWTYDPMQAFNAHLNFRKLGVVVEAFLALVDVFVAAFLALVDVFVAAFLALAFFGAAFSVLFVFEAAGAAPASVFGATKR